MDPQINGAVQQLPRLTVTALKTNYRELFGEDPKSAHKQFLVRRIAWRLQAKAEGELSERARRRARQIAEEGDLGLQLPQHPALLSPSTAGPPGENFRRDRRLPPRGSLLRRSYRGQEVIVKVLEDGFEYEDQNYRSLSAIARRVTGTRWNGLLFFGLAERRNG